MLWNTIAEVGWPGTHSTCPRNSEMEIGDVHADHTVPASLQVSNDTLALHVLPPKRGRPKARGRPRKNVVGATGVTKAAAAAAAAGGKKRGRPPKQIRILLGAGQLAAAATTAGGKKRGRPPKAKMEGLSAAVAVAGDGVGMGWNTHVGGDIGIGDQSQEGDTVKQNMWLSERVEALVAGLQLGVDMGEQLPVEEIMRQGVRQLKAVAATATAGGRGWWEETGGGVAPAAVAVPAADRGAVAADQRAAAADQGAVAADNRGSLALQGAEATHEETAQATADRDAAAVVVVKVEGTPFKEHPPAAAATGEEHLEGRQRAERGGTGAEELREQRGPSPDVTPDWMVCNEDVDRLWIEEVGPLVDAFQPEVGMVAQPLSVQDMMGQQLSTKIEAGSVAGSQGVERVTGTGGGVAPAATGAAAAEPCPPLGAQPAQPSPPAAAEAGMAATAAVTSADDGGPEDVQMGVVRGAAVEARGVEGAREEPRGRGEHSAAGGVAGGSILAAAAAWVLLGCAECGQQTSSSESGRIGMEMGEGDEDDDDWGMEGGWTRGQREVVQVPPGEVAAGSTLDVLQVTAGLPGGEGQEGEQLENRRGEPAAGAAAGIPGVTPVSSGGAATAGRDGGSSADNGTEAGEAAAAAAGNLGGTPASRAAGRNGGSRGGSSDDNGIAGHGRGMEGEAEGGPALKRSRMDNPDQAASVVAEIKHAATAAAEEEGEEEDKGVGQSSAQASSSSGGGAADAAGATTVQVILNINPSNKEEIEQILSCLRGLGGLVMGGLEEGCQADIP